MIAVHVVRFFFFNDHFRLLTSNYHKIKRLNLIILPSYQNELSETTQSLNEEAEYWKQNATKKPNEMKILEVLQPSM